MFFIWLQFSICLGLVALAGPRLCRSGEVIADKTGPILSFAAPELAVSAFSAVIMSGIVIAGLVYRPRNRLFGSAGCLSLALFTMYLFNSHVSFLHG